MSNDASSVASEVMNQATTNTDATQETGQVETQQVETEKAPAIGDKLALFAKLEKKHRLEKETLESEKKSFAEKFKRLQELEEMEKEFSSNPVSLLKKRGYSFEDLHRKALEDADETDLDPFVKYQRDQDAKLEAFKKEFEDKSKKEIDEAMKKLAEKENQSKLQQYRNELKTYVSENKDKYELIHSEGDDGHEVIFEIIRQDYEIKSKQGQDSKPLTFEEACNHYESFLDKRLEKVLNLRKVKSKFGVEDRAETGLDDLLKQSHGAIDQETFRQETHSSDTLTEEQRVQNAIKLLQNSRGFK